MAFGIYRGVREESQITQAVINGDNDYTLFHERRRVIISGTPKLESATVNPNHHRQVTLLVIIEFPSRRVHIQEKAIFATNPSRLRARTTELSRTQEETGKYSVSLWWSPAERSHRGSSVRDS